MVTAAGSPPSWLTISTRLRSAHTSSCSRAAARKVSAAASSTFWPASARWRVSLPMLVVLPAPLTPTTMITVGTASPTRSGCCSGASSSATASGQQRLHRHRLGGLALLDAPLQVLEQELRGLHAGIGHQQRRLQLFVERVVDARAGEHLGDAAAGAAQALAQLVEPTRAVRRVRRARRADPARGAAVSVATGAARPFS